MKTFEYTPTGVCSSKMIFNIENDIVKDVRVIGGCPGNSLGIRELCKGQKIDYIIEKLKGIRCGFKSTSCPDQISKALIKYKEESDNNEKI